MYKVRTSIFKETEKRATPSHPFRILHNRLFKYCQILGLIRAEENRILFEMCQTISQNRVEIKEAVTAIAEIDVFRAKAKVGLRMKGIIPEVRTCHVRFFVTVFSVT